jgi:hypothetical protein
VKKFQLPDANKLRELFDYNAMTGTLSWRISTNNRVKAGDPIKTKYRAGHLAVSIDGVRYLAHRVIWKMTTGEDPVDQIDHIDGDASNNSFANLRESDQSQNRMNSRKNSNNTSGVKGISYHKATNKWRATVGNGYASKQIGIFDDFQSAVEACNLARAEMHGDFARAG